MGEAGFRGSHKGALMLVPMRVSDWQVIRTIRRARTPLGGRALRLVPNSRTKDGSFLTALVSEGLVRVVKGDADPFAATYALTPLGEYAAEYGEYEKTLPPPKFSRTK